MSKAALLRLAAALAAALAGAAPVPSGGAQVRGPQPASSLLAPGPLSKRLLGYAIDARWDPASQTIDARQVVTYRNETGVPLDRFPFHLYLNAFQPGSTFMREVRWKGGTRDNRGTWDEKLQASIEVTQLAVDGMGDLTAEQRFVAPDDGNPADRTVMEVPLPRPVAPGETATFRMSFRSRLGQPVMRAGVLRDYVFAGQWFPKPGVWWKPSGSSARPAAGETAAGWNCHQYHNTTEFFADFATFDVRLTVPEPLIVGSTGVELASQRNGDGTKTLTLRAEDVHDFAWTASERFEVVEDHVDLSSGRVRIRALISPGHRGSARRYLSAAQGTLKKLDEWYGPYPYALLTVVDPPAGARATGGMEYPMLVTAGTSLLMPESLLVPELVTMHEVGHQYWYGMVASNEFEDAWLDEGVNSYVEVKVMEALYGRGTSLVRSRLGTAGSRDVQRLSYRAQRELDPLSRNAWQFGSYASYGAVSYAKAASVLLTLESLVGEQALQAALRDYFQRWRFGQPTEQDFLASLERSLGRDLGWFWERAVYGTQELDYRVTGVRSDRVDWALPGRPGEKKGETVYHSQVTLHRDGDFVFPVLLEVRFDDGHTVRERWDGRDRWRKFEWERKAKLVSAEIDPERRVLLDANRFDDSHVVARQPGAGKVAGYWLLAWQWLGQALAWLA